MTTFPLFPDQPSALCPHRMQVYSMVRETPEVWTLSLINHDLYHYRAGQFALVNIGDSGDIQRAYTLSSTPGRSRFITLTVRHIADGVGSGWLTQQVKPGDYLWLSEAQGDFVADAQNDSRPLLLLAAGCGVTPMISMVRQRLAQHPRQPLQLIYCVRTPQEIIFAAEWQQLTERWPQFSLTLLVEQAAQAGQIAGRLSQDLLQNQVTDIRACRVMICGPAPWMTLVENWLSALGVAPQDIIQERFQLQEAPVSADRQLTLTRLTPLENYRVAVGSTLLAAMELHRLPVTVACRAGVCGSCKTRIVAGKYTTSSSMTLSTEEVAQGYVLACSCQLTGDVTLA
ncbi:NADH oxidoreductase [Erwiniaceae bacterium BAC15a-03b]|uniref:NADH oxidoreductase n=1 Tax=Winslowiella arboricola TaxID=2978220 RepID=A0A9J6PUD5_9GAMM|nr:NADH oxidoreductase [Winslowiella arboricola]MCU5775317.1 NADH oxidoreductase [Winslowiella arboricola]MCU5780286.1 NADH oxidoreductase [Winslowiella arboricola]